MFDNFSHPTEKELRVAKWYVEHRLLLRRLVVVGLIVFNVLLLGFSFYGLLDYFLIGAAEYEKNMRQLARTAPLYQAFHQQNRPQALISGGVVILEEAGKYDFIASLSNPNKKWLADFQYRFAGGGAETGWQDGFLLPEGEKFLLALGQTLASRPSGAQMEIRNLQWQRVEPRLTPNYALFQQERLNIAVENIKFLPRRTVFEKGPSQVSFKVTNRSAFNYWEVGFPIVLYSGSRIAGVNYVTLEQLLSGKTREVNVAWFAPLAMVSNVDIRPEVNIFDTDVYMEIKADKGEEK